MLGLHGAGRADLRAGTVPAPRASGMDWVPPASAAPGPALRITQPETDQHVWRNPEAPAVFNRLVLRAAADASVQQVLWLVDGEPAGLSAPDRPFYWPMVPGRHRFEVRLPLQDTVSSAVRIVVE